YSEAQAFLQDRKNTNVNLNPSFLETDHVALLFWTATSATRKIVIGIGKLYPMGMMLFFQWDRTGDASPAYHLDEIWVHVTGVGYDITFTPEFHFCAHVNSISLVTMTDEDCANETLYQSNKREASKKKLANHMENNLDFIAADHFKWILMAGTHDNRALDRGLDIAAEVRDLTEHERERLAQARDDLIKYFQRAKDALFQMEHNKAYLSTKCYRDGVPMTRKSSQHEAIAIELICFGDAQDSLNSYLDLIKENIALLDGPY
ncbi:hypothetical protein ACJX0J_016191, partial [Zea mays]